MFKKIAAIALAVALAPAAFAAAESGDSEVSIFGNITMTDTTDTYAVFGSWGHYYTDAFVLNLSFGYAGASGSEATIFGVGAEYNFAGEDMVPYVFGGVTMMSISGGGGSETGYTAGAGIKSYLTENAGVRFSVQMDSYDSYDDTMVNLGLFYTF